MIEVAHVEIAVVVEKEPTAIIIFNLAKRAAGRAQTFQFWARQDVASACDTSATAAGFTDPSTIRLPWPPAASAVAARTQAGVLGGAGRGVVLHSALVVQVSHWSGVHPQRVVSSPLRPTPALLAGLLICTSTAARWWRGDRPACSKGAPAVPRWSQPLWFQ